jgi:hypothetical protein
MTNNIIFILPFILFQELLGTAECHLIQVFVYLFAGHANTLIYNADGLIFGVQHYLNARFAYFAFKFSYSR